MTNRFWHAAVKSKLAILDDVSPGSEQRVFSSRLAPRRGFFLVLVLIVIAVATMAVYSFTELMIAYDDSAYLTGDIVQARVNVESGSEAVRLILSESPQQRADSGGLYNNPQLFQAVNVSSGDDGVTRSNFSIVAPDLTETGSYGGIRFGLQNESARLNVNTLIVLEENFAALTPALAVIDESAESVDTENIAVSLLMALPGMSEDVADAILDWIDEDDETRPFGAESDYYTSLATPYAASNGPLHSVEELLLVRGVTASLLFGSDVNRNGVIDADEQQRFGIGIDTPGALGWATFLTVHGGEANKQRDGTPRVNVNEDDLELLYDDLLTALGDETYASFIVAYRVAGKTTSPTSLLAGEQDPTNSDEPTEPAGLWSADLLEQFDLAGGGTTSLTQILDLVDATVTVGGGDESRSYSSPFSSDPTSVAAYMPVLMDVLTTQEFEVMPGRINLNECPVELLEGIPLMTAEVVDAIVESRQTASDDPNHDFETWPLVEGLVTLDQMRQLTPLLTAGGDVFRCQIVGYFEDNSAFHRAEVILDATTVNPKIVSWRDFSHLGRGFDLSVLGRQSSTNLVE